MSKNNNKCLTYKDAGVDLEKGAAFVDRIRRTAKSTINKHVLAQVGGFAGCFEVPPGYEQPVMVTGTDGVGTKLLLALDNPQYLMNTGIDLVAMVVNDIICCGAKPLFFLDYYATGNLNIDHASKFVEGIAYACNANDMVLIGGETAELPGMYKDGDFDAAGFGVGVVEKEDIINGTKNVTNGDLVIGIESSGPHSNGYSLIRKILETNPPPNNIFEQIMNPTHIYSNLIQDIMTKIEIHGIANITGGGLVENIPRVVDDFHSVSIDSSSWPIPSVFTWLQKSGNVTDEEMYNVFNMGIGTVIIVNPSDEHIIKTINEHGFEAWTIGIIEEKNSLDSMNVLIC